MWCSSDVRLGEMLERLAWVVDDLFWRVFSEMWSVCDATWQHQNDLLEAFSNRPPKPAKHITPEARTFFDALPDVVTVYRGGSRERVRGLSWTTDRAVGESFARGHRGIRVPDPVVATATVRKGHHYGVPVSRRDRATDRSAQA